jgi:uncharacterized protein with HEPN domain
MSKDDLVYARHMLDTARRARALMEGKGRADFDSDEALRLALTHLVQIVGEAARRLSTEFRKNNPQFPWRAIVGMRHKVVHDYLNVDEEVLWKTISVELPTLITQLEALLSRTDA